jgi:4-hydroxybenzoate polyprenyltransferase
MQGRKLRSLTRLCRPEQWIKNVIVLAPILFGFKMGQATSWLKALIAVAAFCLVSSASYVFNDIFDIRSDRTHPKKKLRPLAAGEVSIKEAAVLTIVLVLAGVAVAYRLGALFYIVLIGYLALHIGYTLFLKKQVLVDVICIALGFVLRAVGGAVAIRVEVSPWLIICTFMLCLFMGFCKRYSETVYIGPS